MEGAASTATADLRGGMLSSGPRPGERASVDRDAQALPATRHGWFAVIWLIYLIDYADRFALSAVLPAIQAEFDLSDTLLGTLSGALFLGLAVLAVPCAFAVDRFSRKYMIALMTLVWSLATWSTGLAKSFGGLVAARILVGAGEAGYNPAGYALIAAWYPAHRRGTMVGIFQMAQPLGIGVGVLAAGHLAAAFGWRAVFGVLALPGILLALTMLFAPDYKTRKQEASVASVVKPGLADTLRFIAGNRTLQWIYLAQLPITLYIMSTVMWGPTFLVRQYGRSLAEAASATGLITIFGGLGAVAGGWLSDRAARRAPGARISVALLFLLVPLVLHNIGYIGSLYGLPLEGFVLSFGIGQVFISAIWGTLVAAGLDQSPPHYRASVQGFLPMFQAIATVAAGVLSGALSEWLGLGIAMEILLLFGLSGGLLLLLLARRNYDADYQRQYALGRFEVDV